MGEFPHWYCRHAEEAQIIALTKILVCQKCYKELQQQNAKLVEALRTMALECKCALKQTAEQIFVEVKGQK